VVDAGASLEPFTLLGGPLHRLGSRLKLVRGTTNTVLIGVALGALAWLVLLLLALLEGGDMGRFFSLALIGAHVRLLVAIPLFFFAESELAPRFSAFVRYLVRSGVVPEHALPSLQALTARTMRWQQSCLAEAACLLAAVLVPLLAPQAGLAGATAVFDPDLAPHAPLAAAWYWGVCLTLFRFLALRWIWRLLLWSHFLWRLSRLDLHLVPTHPDRAGGLGNLESVHTHFITLIALISIVEGASFAEDIVSGRVAFEWLYPAFAVLLAVDAAIFLAPMLLFTRRLWACRLQGLDDYMELAGRYVSGFERKWNARGGAAEESLLGSADIQSLADMSTAVGIVNEMRIAPISMRLLIAFAMAALLPLLPLLLLKYPVTTLVEQVFTRLLSLPQ
jgi:hypothetical protein